MSVTITLVTTANRTRRFQQSEAKEVAEILDSLKRCTQWFHQRVLVIAGAESTELINPAAITRIEIDARQDLSSFLPPALFPTIQAIPPESPTRPGEIGDTHIATRLDFYFEGGDTLTGWLNSPISSTPGERTARNARLFEEPIITYTTSSGGLGFINPAAMTRVHVNAALAFPPAGAWHANEA